MASSTVTTTIEEHMQQFADDEVAREAKSALGDLSDQSGWGGVERFIDWLRTKVGS